MERFLVQSIAFVLITKVENDKEYVLLQRRFHTGSLDGEYDVSSSGHLEKNETSKLAAIRETKEELGIDIETKDLEFIATLNAKYNKTQYVSVAFHTKNYRGIPQIMEPNKCDDLSWFEISKLPNNLSKHAKCIIDSYQNGNKYIEVGF